MWFFLWFKTECALDHVSWPLYWTGYSMTSRCCIAALLLPLGLWSLMVHSPLSSLYLVSMYCFCTLSASMQDYLAFRRHTSCILGPVFWWVQHKCHTLSSLRWDKSPIKVAIWLGYPLLPAAHGLLDWVCQNTCQLSACPLLMQLVWTQMLLQWWLFGAYRQ